MDIKEFYRIENITTGRGLWYDMNGNFTGLIHSEQFSFCKNKDLPMQFNKEIVGYLSAVETLEDLFSWFPKEDLRRLYEFGYRIFKYQSDDYKIIDNHFAINQDNFLSKTIIEL